MTSSGEEKEDNSAVEEEKDDFKEWEDDLRE